jgi:hypothetical protein
MPTISLDQIRKDIEAKYAPLVIPFTETVTSLEGEPGVRERTCTLVQVLRLSQDVRKQLVAEQRASQAPAGDDDYDETGTLESMRRIVRLVADDLNDAFALIDAVGDDIAVLAAIIEAYTGGTQAGEA